MSNQFTVKMLSERTGDVVTLRFDESSTPTLADVVKRKGPVRFQDPDTHVFYTDMEKPLKAFEGKQLLLIDWDFSDMDSDPLYAQQAMMAVEQFEMEQIGKTPVLPRTHFDHTYLSYLASGVP